MINNDKEFKARLKETKFVVEATLTEKQLLWEKYSTGSLYKTELNTYNWEEINPGYAETVGMFCGYPVTMCIFWAKINGVLVLFYEATSGVVDHRMIEEWFETHCYPKWHKRHAQCDAGDFRYALSCIDELSKS